MFEKNMSKAQVIGLLNKMADNKPIFVYSDQKWNYPEQNDTQKSCTMLDMNFNIEKRPGIVIHIPNLILEDLEIKNIAKKPCAPNPLAENIIRKF